ncbi:hypothetical protein BJ742DRAFT_872129 [Cladochytrium replicatum]|nr:hypothetical protein BJ742DRAFT_872129 [Cladochytrium replicatum]
MFKMQSACSASELSAVDGKHRVLCNCCALCKIMSLDVVDRHLAHIHIENAFHDFAVFITKFLSPFITESAALDGFRAHLQGFEERLHHYPVLYTTDARPSAKLSDRSSITQLPPEILCTIITAARTKKCAWTLAQTCKKIHDVAIPILFERVVVWPSNIFLLASTHNKSLSYTKEFEFIENDEDEYPSHSFHLLKPVVEHMTSLTSLEVHDFRSIKGEIHVLAQLISQNTSLCRLSLDIIWRDEEEDYRVNYDQMINKALDHHTCVQEIELRSWATTCILPSASSLFPCLRSVGIAVDLNFLTLSSIASLLAQPTLRSLKIRVLSIRRHDISQYLITRAQAAFANNSNLISMKFVTEDSPDLQFMLDIIKDNSSVERLVLETRCEGEQLSFDVDIFYHKTLKEVAIGANSDDPFSSFDQFASRASKHLSLEKLTILRIPSSDAEFGKILRLLETNTNLIKFKLDGSKHLTVNHCRGISTALQSSVHSRLRSLRIMLGRLGDDRSTSVTEVHEKLWYLRRHREKREDGRYVYVEPASSKRYKAFSMTFYQFFGIEDENELQIKMLTLWDLTTLGAYDVKNGCGSQRDVAFTTPTEGICGISGSTDTPEERCAGLIETAASPPSLWALSEGIAAEMGRDIEEARQREEKAAAMEVELAAQQKRRPDHKGCSRSSFTHLDKSRYGVLSRAGGEDREGDCGEKTDGTEGSVGGAAGGGRKSAGKWKQGPVPTAKAR